MSTEGTVVEMREIHKQFGEIIALDGVDLTLREGEVLGLVGDNGAGKSTLIKCLAGAHEPTSGTVRLRGEAVVIDSPRAAKARGIETTFQDLALAPNLTVAQNVFLGREEMIGPDRVFGLLNRSAMRDRAGELLDDLEIDVSPDQTVGGLSGGQRQLVAVSRMLLSDPDIVIMDEPTSALSVEGADRVLELIEQMRDRGISVLLISHNLEYLQRVADRIKVLHQGHDAGVLDAETVTRDEVVSRMVSGRSGVEESEQTPA
jgi:ABC-type sugar transport system ATPase subunit